MISRLKLITPVPASGVFPSGWFEAQKGYEPKGAFLDFAIDERSLWQMLGEPDMKSVIWTEHSSEGMRKAMQRLMLREPSELSDGRVPIFICSLCSNLGCGAITAVIESSGTLITWHDFGVQNDFEEEVWREDYLNVGPFTFDRAQYEQEIEQSIPLTRG